LILAIKKQYDFVKRVHEIVAVIIYSRTSVNKFDSRLHPLTTRMIIGMGKRIGAPCFAVLLVAPQVNKELLKVVEKVVTTATVSGVVCPIATLAWPGKEHS